MRLFTLIASALALLFWVWALSRGIDYLDFVACVLLPETSIRGELIHKVVLPSAMLTLAAVSLILAMAYRASSKVFLLMSLVSLVSIGFYYVVMSPISVNEPVASICRT